MNLYLMSEVSQLLCNSCLHTPSAVFITAAEVDHIRFRAKP